MVWLWILGGILLVLILTLLIPLGVQYSFGEAVRLQVRIGPAALQILPPPEKKKKSAKQKRRKEHKAQAKKAKEPLITFAELRQGAGQLWEAAKKALHRTRRHVKLHPFRLSFTFGGDDPSQVAQLYGWADTAVWTLMPPLQRLTKMPDPHVHLGVDYQRQTTEISGELGASVRLGALMIIGFTFIIPALRWYLTVRKQRVKKEETDDKTEIHKGE